MGFFTEYLDYYLTKGIVFSNERENNLPEIEAKIREMAYSYVQSGQFLHMNQRKLAALILYEVRQALKVNEVWNEPVEFYTQMGTYEVYTIVKENRKNIAKNQPGKKLILKHSISSFSSSTVSFSSYSSFNSRSNSSLAEATTPRMAITSVIV